MKVVAPGEGRAGQLLPIGRIAHFKWILVGILFLSVATKLYRLSQPESFYFDEVYHAFTATEYLHGDRQAYDPWAKSPPGRAHEWTHPPLAKTLMAVMMGVFGENSFGWRIGAVICGTTAIYLAAHLALELFDSELIALLTAFLLSVEGLFFAQSRIGMNDSYFVCFALLSVLSYVKWKRDFSATRWLVLSSVGLGLAAASKWTALYLFVIIGLDLLRDVVWVGDPVKRVPWRKAALAFLLLPPVVYLSSYFQFFLLGNDLARFWTVQQQMWWYHSGLKATHSYQSVPWQWLLNVRPVWMWVGSSGPGMTANIYSLGNSVVLLGGLVAVYQMLQEKAFTWSKWFVLLCYFMLWLPWVISPRLMLFYHYMPAVPFLCIILARFLERLLRNPDPARRKWAYGFLAGALLWFVVTYPNLTGIPVPESFAKWAYFSIPGWK